MSTDILFWRVQVKQISDDVISVDLHGGNSIIIMEPELDEIENIIGVLNEKKLKHKKIKEVSQKEVIPEEINEPIDNNMDLNSVEEFQELYDLKL